MTDETVRRAQLIAPFGVGAITVMPDGTAVLTAGLDHWYEMPDNDVSQLTIEEFTIEEWRLQRVLRVKNFRLPPDYRVNKTNNDQKNLRIKIPALRFPRWNFCPICRRLEKLPLSYSEWRRCSNCESKGKKGPVMSQVPIVAMCQHGHLQDFPFQEWVHGDIKPQCTGALRLVTTGSASLSSQVIKCECGKSRSLGQITDADANQTYLSSSLAKGKLYLCRGSMPWHGSDQGSGCESQLRASLRAASNLYYALVRSSIFLPRNLSETPETLFEILQQPPISTLLAFCKGLPTTDIVNRLRHTQSYLIGPYSDEQISRALQELNEDSNFANSAEGESDDENYNHENFRFQEYSVLRNEIDSAQLKIRSVDTEKYDSRIEQFFQRIMLVDQLRETRAFWGFNRIYPEAGTLEDRKRMLWNNYPDYGQSWLPAYIVKGEGIYLEINEEQLAQWETQTSVVSRIQKMSNQYSKIRGDRNLQDRQITPRLVLIHTLAHLLINQLTYECGYSSASLRERLYVSHGKEPMAGLLIYTAAGDSEGTMGGLVRMAKPGYLEPILESALLSATWCSSDPICMELGEGGQGPDASNLAACHSCALLPETACEEFNRFLDRGLAVGTIENKTIGFFYNLFTNKN